MFSLKNLIKGAAGNGSSRLQGRTGFPRTLNKAQLWATAADITTPADTWIRVGEYTIPAQQVVHLGYGKSGTSGMNFEEMGHVVLHMVDDTATNSAEEAGMFRCGYTNASEIISEIVFEERSEQLGSGAATTTVARNLQIPLAELPPQNPVLAQEDSLIIVDFRADAADISVITAIATGAPAQHWSLPITVYQ